MSQRLSLERRFYRIRLKMASERPDEGSLPARDFLREGNYAALRDVHEDKDRKALESRATRQEIGPDTAVHSGELLEVELWTHAPDDLEYVLIEDPRPAGCEPVDESSDEACASLPAHRELRDEKAALFISRIPKGRWRVTHRLRAETPGWFQVLPALAYAMYAPEIRATSAAAQLKIRWGSRPLFPRSASIS